MQDSLSSERDNPPMDTLYDHLNLRLESVGLCARGGLHLDPDLDRRAAENGFRTLVLAGNVGSSCWTHFESFRTNDRGDDPLDAWSKSIGETIAAEFNCQALYPFDKPWWPWQNWCQRIEGLRPSPLGILIHPQYGLWHGYRVAFAFHEAIEVPPPVTLEHACDRCADKPCISHCPAAAVADTGFDLPGCRNHLTTPAGQAGCMTQGCLARNACPVGREYRYNAAQLRFHMAALDNK